ncbi:MAG: hypothetical protein ABJH06_16850 [Paraglaciecola sp.]|uniref:hypothetical protein n=1 Tax=Paraglaciecola sp. TaxID=1920173 RepID=UPI003298F20F
MLSLKNIMRANATSCLVFGGLFAMQANMVAEFLGGDSPAPQLYVLILGWLLILNGIHLFWESRTLVPKKSLILYFSIGDYLWVAGSATLILSGLWITTTAGVIVASVIALIVGIFGVLQMTTRKAMGHC